MSTNPVSDHPTFKILVVDDTPATLSMLAKHLEEHGYQVVVAEEGEEAIQRARIVMPDLVLLDVLMPGVDGFETCRRLKADESTRDIPVIFMTALAETQSKVIGFDAGGVDFVTKPIQLEEVLARVRTHLTLYALQQKLERRVEERTAELARVNRMLKILSHCNQTVVRATAEPELLREICRVLVEQGGYPLAWIGFAGQDEDRTVRPVAHQGDEAGYLETSHVSWADKEQGHGPIGKAIRSGKPSIIHDIQTDPGFASWREDAVRRGFRSFIVLPLRGDDGVLGVLNIYSVLADAFHTQEVELLMELAGDLAYGLRAIRAQDARNQAKEALRESEERYHSLFDGLPAGLYRSTPAGEFIEVNPALVQMLGYPDRGSLLAVKANELYVDTEVRQRWKALIELENKVQDYEVRVRRYDGSLIWMRDTSRVVRDPQGQVVRYEGSLDDITERKRGEEALRLSEDRYRALYEDNPSMYFTVDAQGTVLSVNPFGAEQLGYPMAELVGHPVLGVFHPDDRAAVSDQLAACLQIPNQVVHWEFRKVRKDGGIMWVREAARAVQGGGGSLVVLIVCEDVSVRKQAEERLWQLHEFNEDIVQNMAEGLIVINGQGGVSFVNPAQAALLGCTPGELMGRPWTTMVPPDQQAVVSGAEGPAGRLQVGRYDLELARKDGTRVPVLASVSQCRAADRAGEFLVVFTDLSERKRLENQLLQAQKMEAIGQLAGGIAHDFNNLLTVIAGFSDLLLASFQIDDPRHEDLEEIRRAAERARALTRQLLAFSRRQVLQPRLLDLNSTVENVEKMLRRMVGEDIEFQTVLGSPSACVNADPGQIEQVLMNLVVNARDAMPHGGKLVIETCLATLDSRDVREHVDVVPGVYAMLAVSDTGMGIDEAIRSKIFEPFFTTKAEGKGTGLGLSTVYGIVKQSGGHIGVESELGRGTAFKVYLPVAKENAQPARLSSSDNVMASGSETILLVEDEETLRNMIRRILRDSGYSVLEVSTGAEALALSEQYPSQIHLLLTDVVLPGGMSGWDLSKRLLALRPGIKVLCMSGYAYNAAIQHNIMERNIPFLEKPFKPAALTQKVREVLEASPLN